MKKVLYLLFILIGLVACQEDPEPEIVYSARISGPPGMSFNSLITAYQSNDTSKTIQDFIGNLPLDGNFLITYGNDFKGIEVTVQKGNDLGELKLEVFVYEVKAGSATTAEPQGIVTLSAGEVK